MAVDSDGLASVQRIKVVVGFWHNEWCYLVPVVLSTELRGRLIQVHTTASLTRLLGRLSVLPEASAGIPSSGVSVLRRDGD